MNSFYGNLKNNSRASFIFDKIYPTRYAMDMAVKNGTDGVFVNRYVLIAYNFSQSKNLSDHYEASDISQYRFDTYLSRDDNYGKLENPLFVEHRDTDIQQYGAQYDKTVWMKIYTNNKEKYIQVGALNAAAPAFELFVDAPGEEQGRPHFDFYHSGDLSYSYHAPKNWDIILNHYDLTNDDLFDRIVFDEKNPYERNMYFYKENGIYKIDYGTDPTVGREYYYPVDPSFFHYYTDLYTENSNRQYPYVNSKGFSSITRSYDFTTKDDIDFTEVASGEQYPDHNFLPIKLTKDTYVRNTFYTKEPTKINYIPVTLNSTKDSYVPGKYYYTDKNKQYYLDKYPNNIAREYFIKAEKKEKVDGQIQYGFIDVNNLKDIDISTTEFSIYYYNASNQEYQIEQSEQTNDVPYIKTQKYQLPSLDSKGPFYYLDLNNQGQKVYKQELSVNKLYYSPSKTYIQITDTGIEYKQPGTYWKKNGNNFEKNEYPLDNGKQYYELSYGKYDGQDISIKDLFEKNADGTYSKTKDTEIQQKDYYIQFSSEVTFSSSKPYVPRTYYYKDNENRYIREDYPFKPGTTEFQEDLYFEQIIYTKNTDAQNNYTPGTYYILTDEATSTYSLDQSSLSFKNKTYYELKDYFIQINKEFEYEPNIYYYNNNNNKILDTYPTDTKNEYYILNTSDAYYLNGPNDKFDPNKTYYIKTQGYFKEVNFDNDNPYRANKFFYKDSDDLYILDTNATTPTPGQHYQYEISFKTSAQNDTKRLDLELPSVGNAISDVYDTIYGRPLNPNYPNGIKYIYDAKKEGESSYPYKRQPDEEHTLQCSIDGQYYYLTPEEWEDEDPLFDSYDENAHPIPVYNLANNEERPYTQQQLFNFLNIEPYNNITPQDPVSVAWGVEELKKYISELRYLSHGAIDGEFDPLVYNGNGLQSDWSIDDPTAFGYIYNKPTIITHYKQCMDNKPIDENKYLYIRDVDDDKHVPYFFEGQIKHINPEENGVPSFDYKTDEYIQIYMVNTFEYQPNIYYYKKEDESYELDSSLTMQNNRIYYKQVEEKYLLIEEYQPNTYYYKTIHGYALDSSAEMRNLIYYKKESKMNQSNIHITFKNPNERQKTYSNIDTPYVYEIADITTHFKFDDENTRSYTYNKLGESNNTNSSNTYYYLQDDIFELDKNPNFTSGRTYYEKIDNYKYGSFNTLLNVQSATQTTVAYHEIELTEEQYQPSIYYYKNENEEFVKDDNQLITANRIYYEQITTQKSYWTLRGNFINGTLFDKNGSLDKYEANKLYLGFGGKIIYQIWFKDGKIFDLQGEETIEQVLNILNRPSFYDEYISKIVYATNRLETTTIPSGFMDATMPRDGKFHIYTNIRYWETGLPIEKIWQEIPAEDIIISEMYYNINDTADTIIGENTITIPESITVLDSPFIALETNMNDIRNSNNNISNKIDSIEGKVNGDISNSIATIQDTITNSTTGLTTRINALENYVGNDSNTATLAVRMNILENYVGSDSTTATLGYRVNAIEDYVGSDSNTTTLAVRMNTLENYVGNDSNTATLAIRMNTLEGYNTNNRINTLENYVGNDSNTATLSVRMSTLENYVGNDSTTATLGYRVNTTEINMNNIQNTITNSTTGLTVRMNTLENYVGNDSTTATLGYRINTLENYVGNDSNTATLAVRVSTLENIINENNTP